MSPIDIRDRLGDRFRILTASPASAPAPADAARRRRVVLRAARRRRTRRCCAPRAVFAGWLRPRRDHRGARPDRRAGGARPGRLAGAQVARGRRRLGGHGSLRAARDDPPVRRGRARGDGCARRDPRPARRHVRRRGGGALGRAGTARRGATASTGWRSSSPTSARRSGGAGRAGDVERRGRHRRARGADGRVGPAVRDGRLGPGAPRGRDARRRPSPPAAVHGRGVGLLHRPRRRGGRGRADRRPRSRPTRATSRASRGCRVSSRRSPTCTPATSTATSRWPNGSRRSPGNARGWGLSLLLDGLQASGRVDEALALTDAAMAAARDARQPVLHRLRVLDVRQRALAHRPRPGARRLARGPRLRAPAPGRLLRRLHRTRRGTPAPGRRRPRRRAHDVRRRHRRVPAGRQRRAAHDHAGQRDRAVRAHRPARRARPRCTRRSSASPAASTTSPSSPSSPTGSWRGWAHEAFDDRTTRRASAMDLDDTAHFARQRDPAGARPSSATQAATRAARPGGLSPREVDVLRLAAEGLTTREIAERLFISAKTADRHIQNIYTKIGTSNRAGGDAVGGGARRRRLSLTAAANGENSGCGRVMRRRRTIARCSPRQHATGDSDDPRHHPVRRLGPLLDRLQHRRRREARRARLQGRARLPRRGRRPTASGSSSTGTTPAGRASSATRRSPRS